MSPVALEYEIERDACQPEAHDWQEQVGEPPVDVCSQCGEVRE